MGHVFGLYSINLGASQFRYQFWHYPSDFASSSTPSSLSSSGVARCFGASLTLSTPCGSWLQSFLDHFFVINSLPTVYGAAALYLSVIFRYILCGSVAVHAAVALESQLQASPRVATWPMVSFCVAFRDYYLGSLHVS